MSRIPRGALAMLVADCPDPRAADAVNHAAVMRDEGEWLVRWVLSAPSQLSALDRLGLVVDDLLKQDLPDMGDTEEE